MSWGFEGHLTAPRGLTNDGFAGLHPSVNQLEGYFDAMLMPCFNELSKTRNHLIRVNAGLFSHGSTRRMHLEVS